MQRSPPAGDPHAEASRPGAEATALSLAQDLLSLLGQEFDVLKGQQLDQFESLQSAKEALLQQIATHVRQHDPQTADSASRADFKDLIRRCRDAHRRNETLIRHQLTSIQGTLQALTAPASSLPTEVYDRTGRISARLGRLMDGNG